MEPLPVSVIVPHKVSRSAFFRNCALPSIEANQPAEIIVEPNDGSAGTGAPYRNAGFLRATKPYVLFCDDDCVLMPGALQRMLEAFPDRPNRAFVYCDHIGICAPWARHHSGCYHRHVAGAFDYNRLRHGNFISTMSMMHREDFPGFDEKLPQYDDWDLFLTLAERGVRGVYLAETLFAAFYLDDGVTREGTGRAGAVMVRAKHDLNRRKEAKA